LQEGKAQHSASNLGVVHKSHKHPNQADWEKLMRVMKYLNGTMSPDDLRVVKWFVDTSFAVHPESRL
jgi:hypothetical protein